MSVSPLKPRGSRRFVAWMATVLSGRRKSNLNAVRCARSSCLECIEKIKFMIIRSRKLCQIFFPPHHPPPFPYPEQSHTLRTPAGCKINIAECYLRAGMLFFNQPTTSKSNPATFSCCCCWKASRTTETNKNPTGIPIRTAWRLCPSSGCYAMSRLMQGLTFMNGP